MTRKAFRVRTGSGRSAPRGTLVLGFAGILLAATTMRVDLPLPSWLEHPRDDLAAARDAEQATALLDAVRGGQPLICRLAARALRNHWGGDAHAGIPGPESIGMAGDSVFEWALTARVEPALIPQLRAALADPDGCVRRTAAVLLGHTSTASLGAELRAELASASAPTREAALLAIGYAGKTPDVRAAAAALDDPDHAVKVAAVWALGMIGDPAAVPPLTPMLSDRDPVIRAATAMSLGQTGSTDAIPALAAALGSDADARVRQAAAVALGQIDQ